MAATPFLVIPSAARDPSHRQLQHRRHVVAALQRPHRVDQRADVVALSPGRGLVDQLALDLGVGLGIGRRAARRLRRERVGTAVGGDDVELGGDGRLVIVSNRVSVPSKAVLGSKGLPGVSLCFCSKSL
ncbi:MAG: hypothetical protein LCH95_23620 [Proteobacteria bacterium]|nr:hypothetical protein [Pseudomonadota bacterium]